MRVRPRTSGSITDLLLALACMNLAVYTAPQRSWTRGSRGTAGVPGAGRGTARTDPSAGPDRTGGPPYGMRARGYWEAEVSLVIGINQTNHSTNQERPCTTIQGIKKELSICPSQQRPDLVTFPALSQIKPHTPRLVVPFRQFL